MLDVDDSNFPTDSIPLLDVDVAVGAGVGLEENPNPLCASSNQDLTGPAIRLFGEGREMSGPVVGLSKSAGSSLMLIEEDNLTRIQSRDTSPMLKKRFWNGTNKGKRHTVDIICSKGESSGISNGTG